MGKVYAELDERLRKFIARQPVFFVATAPCLTSDGEGGHVNVSPKGYRDTFAVLDPTTVAYVDLTGSGAETIAHLRAATNGGRIRSHISVFAPDTPHRPGPRIWNQQVICYAGYRTAAGGIIGDPANVALTDLAASLGWEGHSGAFDIRPPDGITLDVRMPRLDGWETAVQLRRSPDTAHIKVVLITARAQEDDKSHGRRVGADAYLTKPFDPNEMIRVVRELATPAQ